MPNGASIRLRAIQPDDARRLLALCRGLSARTLYARFFSVRRLLPEEAHSLANVDYDRRMAIVAEADEGQESELVGVARYGPSGDGTIDVGLVVADGWQGLGLDPRLLDEILKAGEQRGIGQFHADVLTDNGRALRLLARHTAIVQRTIDSGITSLVFDRWATLQADEPGASHQPLEQQFDTTLRTVVGLPSRTCSGSWFPLPFASLRTIRIHHMCHPLRMSLRTNIKT